MNLGWLIYLVVILSIPMVLMFLWYDKTKKFIHILPLAITSVILVWLLVNIAAYYQTQKFEKQLYSYDLNKDGSFSKDELTEEAEEALAKFSNDTGRALAPITGIFFGVLVTIIGFSVYITSNKIRNKIYNKNNT